MSTLSVCILAADRGHKVCKDLDYPHKALLRIGPKAVISLIVERFPPDTQFVVAIGHEGSLIKDFLHCAHPKTHFEFVEVQNVSGPGSGPGQSLFECRDKLTRPFILTCADTLWTEKIDFDLDKNVFYLGQYPEDQPEDYCNIQPDKNGLIKKLRDKMSVDTTKFRPWIGLASINNVEAFFSGFENPEVCNGQVQVSSGINKLKSDSPVYTQNINSWMDTGSFSHVKTTRAELGYEKIESLRKPDENIYYSKDLVTKYFADSELCKLRVERFKIDADIHPHLVEARDNFYSYQWSEGVPASQILSESVLENILNFAKDKIWIEREPTKKPNILCREFYEEQTRKRLVSFSKITKNRKLIESCDELFEKIIKFSDFGAKANFCRIHGDFQLDNILVDDSGNLNFIDFRQGFAGEIMAGDKYYDLGKLVASLRMNFSNLTEPSETIKDIETRKTCLNHVRNFCETNQLDFEHAHNVSSIVLLRMIGLHCLEEAENIALHLVRDM